ncbi:hypothetical protein ACL9RI_27445 [Janthinobacterium sp. Mn2066]|uniref:hypothetical protein n=1 Tax=Janthinobacterium sp. Mn2066 TaxID=3395264 RepID=UPI003BEA27C7
MNIADTGLALIYVFVWCVSGFNFGRIARRYYREKKLGWPNGKYSYAMDWILSMVWFIGSAFILGELDRVGNFHPFDLLGPVALVVMAALGMYRYRPR